VNAVPGRVSKVVCDERRGTKVFSVAARVGRSAPRSISSRRGAPAVSMTAADNRVSHQDTFEESCWRADEKRRREAEPERLAQLRRLLDDNVSLERCWAELNLRCRDGAPQSTVEALVYELRTHGLTALQHPNCLRRLDDVSATQLREVTARLIRLQPKYPAITDDLLLKLGGLL
jgi:hypothetical protein